MKEIQSTGNSQSRNEQAKLKERNPLELNEKAVKVARKTNIGYQNNYRQSVLGYKKARSRNLKTIDTVKRVAIIFDHVVHRKGVRQII